MLLALRNDQSEVSVAATGRVSEDLPVIKEILDGLDEPKPNYYRDPWWGEPCSDEAIDALANEYGELPQDVIEFYKITNIATFGSFEDMADPLVAIELRGYLEAICDPLNYPPMYEDGQPKGDGLLPMSLEHDRGCLIELGGPDHGRVINFPADIEYGFYRTMAWSLGDAVACIRDLYEFGWFQDLGDPTDFFYKTNQSRPPFGTTEYGLAELAKIQPIIDKWNCDPVIATFNSPYRYNPERPTRPRTT